MKNWGKITNINKTRKNFISDTDYQSKVKDLSMDIFDAMVGRDRIKERSLRSQLTRYENKYKSQKVEMK